MFFSRLAWLSKVKIPSPLSGVMWYASTATKPYKVSGSKFDATY